MEERQKEMDKIDNKTIKYLFSSHNIVRVIRSRWFRFARNVARMEETIRAKITLKILTERDHWININVDGT
jgi:hypothetical protein